ncbi:MAG: glycoside hydrolase family 5 protein [Bacteroidales bacterium]|nr:glycoside hydrolase family 5 protein [Bacteroidales bacterium]
MKKMVSSILTVSAAFMMSSCGGSCDESAKDGFFLGTGVNVSHWLSQSESRGEARANQITKKDFDSIAAMGFDHVRLPIDEVQMYDENLNRYEDAFVLLKNAIDWTLENNMNIIVDLHIIRSFHFNNENEGGNTLFEKPGEQQRLIDIWKDLQKFLKDYPTDRVAYELLNEAIAPTHEALNDLEARLIAAIRETEPDRYIVIGSNWQQSPETIQYLNPPANDKKLIVAFHYYNPLLITHYKAPWTPLKDFEGKVAYPGQLLADTAIFKTLSEEQVTYLKNLDGVWDKQFMYNQIKPAIDKAKEFGLQAYCGEFGVYPPFIDKETRLQWYKDICEIFRENNIANAHWCYKGDFPVVNEDGSRNELPEVLVNKK